MSGADIERERNRARKIIEQSMANTKGRKELDVLLALGRASKDFGGGRENLNIWIDECQKARGVE